MKNGGKEGGEEKVVNSNKKFILGILIGAIVVAIISIIVFLPSYLARGEKTCIAGENKISFMNKDVHLSLKTDFPQGTPFYDGNYCQNRYMEKNGKKAISCAIAKVDTMSRVNPMITDVECICETEA